MTPLEAEIRAIIALDGPMTLAQYMSLCLGHPVHGYYMTRDPIGASGDFTTAPEISQMFGELIGLWAATAWRKLGSPAAVNLIELGPGRGTLMADALRAAALLPEFRSAIAVHLVETSPILRVRQQTTLEDAAVSVSWHRDLSSVPDGPSVIVANEFFDALPLHQFVKGVHGWHERRIGIGPDDRLALAVSPDVALASETLIPRPAADASFGAVFEWRPANVVVDISRRLVGAGGAALIIDYGHIESGTGDTLQAVRRHAFADPLEAPGEADLTAHVDFAALARAARSAGAEVTGPVTQGYFLRRLGIEVRAQRLKAASSLEQARDIDLALARLVEGGEGMGELFKVIAIADPKLGDLPGFDR